MGIVFTGYPGYNDVVVNNSPKMHMFTPLDILGCACWLRSDKNVTLSSNKVSAWGDLSGNGRSVTQQTVSSQPDYVSSGGANNLPYFNLTQSGDVGKEMHWVTNAWSALTAGEIFWIGQRLTDPTMLSPGGGGGMWQTNVVETLVPYPNGTIYDFSLTTVRKDAIPYTVGLFALPYCYNVSSQANLWTNRLNGTQLFTTSTNAFGISSTTQIFGSANPSIYYLGKHYEFIVFNRVLSSQERTQMNLYIYNRYGIIGS